MNRRFSIKKRKDFAYIYKRGKSVGGKAAVLLYKQMRHNNTLVGFSVSKKVGNAVCRNKVKRRMKEVVRSLLPNIKKGHSLIFVARSNAFSLTFAEIEKSLRALLEKAGLLQE